MDDRNDVESTYRRGLEQTRIPETITATMSKVLDDDDDDDLVDEEQLKRILACKRLSEGQLTGHYQQMQQRLPSSAAGHHLASVGRKNSLHMIGESLPPVTEGVPVRHHHHHHLSSANMGAGGGDQIGSGSLRSKAAQMAGKRNSQDDNTVSCSSSNSLDGSSGGSGLSRRRSSTVSQCSSVLSEGTRQQLNFDLSPDLPPDSSILEANTISPVDFERPASPEPSSEPLDSNEECSFDMRPISRMSGTFCSSGAGDDELMQLTVDSPDFAPSDSNKSDQIGTNGQLVADLECEQQDGQNSSEQHQHHQRESNIRDNLERIISHVSTVRVSGGAGGGAGGGGDGDAIVREPHEEVGLFPVGQKRAHTPFGLNIQRNKTTHMSPATPSPTAHLSEASVSAKLSAACE